MPLEQVVKLAVGHRVDLLVGRVRPVVPVDRRGEFPEAQVINLSWGPSEDGSIAIEVGEAEPVACVAVSSAPSFPT